MKPIIFLFSLFLVHLPLVAHATSSFAGVSGRSFSDTLYEAWVSRSVNGAGIDVVVDNEGYVYVAGPSAESGTDNDYAVIKYSANGEEQWVARYDGPGNAEDQPFSLTVDREGSVYVTGGSTGSDMTMDFMTIKYSGAGTEEWAVRYTGPESGFDVAYGLAVDSEANVYVTGYSWGSSTSNDYVTIKYDSSGTEQWLARYTSSDGTVDEAYALAIDSLGNVYVTGLSTNLSGTNVDYLTIKYDPSGVQQWVERYDGMYGDDTPDAIAVDGAGNVCVTGMSWSAHSPDYASVKYDASGEQLWVARYDGGRGVEDLPHSLAIDAQGNAYVSGFTGSYPHSDYLTVKYDDSGVEQWVARYGGPGNSHDVAYDVAVDNSGNVFVTGWSGVLENPDYVTIKYDAAGMMQWLGRYHGSGLSFDGAYGLALDASGGICVTGFSTGCDDTWDITTVRYQPNPPNRDVSVVVVLDPPSGNGTFDYTVTLTNNTEDPLTLDIWTDIMGPGGRSKVGKVRTGKTLGRNRSHTITNTANLGPGAPIGDYLFSVSVGESLCVVTASGSALYTKSALAKDVVHLVETTPTVFSLHQNHPNPFNPSTTIEYDLPTSAYVRLEVFNVLGEKMSVLKDGLQEAGYHSVVFDGNKLPSGVYFYRLQAGNFTETRKLMLLR